MNDAAESNRKTDERRIVGFTDLWRIIRKRWKLSLIAAAACVLLFAIYAFAKAPTYRATVLLSYAKNEEESTSLASVASRFGNLAALAGLTGASGGSREEAVALLTSSILSRRFVERNDLMPIFFADRWDAENHAWKPKRPFFLKRLLGMAPPREIPTLQQAHGAIDKIRNASEDQYTGLIRFSIDWIDSTQTAEWANGLVKELNDLLREKAITESQRSLEFLQEQLVHASAVEMRDILFQLIETHTKTIMLAEAREDFAFKVLDPATIPELPISPNRPFLIVLGCIIGALLGAALAVFLELRRSAA